MYSASTHSATDLAKVIEANSAFLEKVEAKLIVILGKMGKFQSNYIVKFVLDIFKLGTLYDSVESLLTDIKDYIALINSGGVLNGQR